MQPQSYLDEEDVQKEPYEMFICNNSVEGKIYKWLKHFLSAEETFVDYLKPKDGENKIIKFLYQGLELILEKMEFCKFCLSRMDATTKTETTPTLLLLRKVTEGLDKVRLSCNRYTTSILDDIDKIFNDYYDGDECSYDDGKKHSVSLSKDLKIYRNEGLSCVNDIIKSIKDISNMVYEKTWGYSETLSNFDVSKEEFFDKMQSEFLQYAHLEGEQVLSLLKAEVQNWKRDRSMKPTPDSWGNLMNCDDIVISAASENRIVETSGYSSIIPIDWEQYQKRAEILNIIKKYSYDGTLFDFSNTRLQDDLYKKIAFGDTMLIYEVVLRRNLIQCEMSKTLMDSFFKEIGLEPEPIYEESKAARNTDTSVYVAAGGINIQQANNVGK